MSKLCQKRLVFIYAFEKKSSKYGGRGLFFNEDFWSTIHLARPQGKVRATVQVFLLDMEGNQL